MDHLVHTLGRTIKVPGATPLGIPKQMKVELPPKVTAMKEYLDGFEKELAASIEAVSKSPGYSDSPILTVARAFRLDGNTIVRGWADGYIQSLKENLRVYLYDITNSPILVRLRGLVEKNPLPPGGDPSKLVENIVDQFLNDSLLAILKNQGRVAYRAAPDIEFADALVRLGFILKDGDFIFDGQGRQRLIQFLNTWCYPLLTKPGFSQWSLLERFEVNRGITFGNYYDVLKASIQYLSFVEMHKGYFSYPKQFLEIIFDEQQLDLTVKNIFEVEKYAKPHRYFPFLVFPEALAAKLRPENFPADLNSAFEETSLYGMYHWAHIGDREFRFVDPHSLNRSQLQELKVRTDKARTNLTHHLSQFTRYLLVHGKGDEGSPDSLKFLPWIVYQLYHNYGISFVDDMLTKGTVTPENQAKAAEYIVSLLKNKLPLEFYFFFGDAYSNQQLLEYTQGALTRILEWHRVYRSP